MSIGRASTGEDAGRVGRIRFITLVTAIRPFRTWWLRRLFALTDRFPCLLAIAPMKAVHFLHWNILETIPYNGTPQIVEQPDHPYLIWGTVFNGVGDPYIEGFVVHAPRQIRAIWGTSYGFPGTRSVSRLARYIDDLSWNGGYSYFAYPDATVRTVQSAVNIQKEHPFLVNAAKNKSSYAEFARTYRGFLVRCQADL